MVAKSKKAAATAAASSESAIDPDEALILNYLNTQNRPYNSNDLFNNLHGAVGKTALTRALNSLAERGEITAKTFGKSVLYVARQDLLPVPSNEDLNALDDEINRLKQEIMTEKEANKQVQSKLNMMTSSLTTEDLKLRIQTLKAEVAEMQERLEPLERGTVKVDPEERARVEKDLEVYSKAHKQRKKMCMEIIGMLSESTGKKPAEIIEELELEVDPVN